MRFLPFYVCLALVSACKPYPGHNAATVKFAENAMSDGNLAIIFAAPQRGSAHDLGAGPQSDANHLKAIINKLVESGKMKFTIGKPEDGLENMNAARADTLAGITKAAKSLPADGTLLIYLLGHGSDQATVADETGGSFVSWADVKAAVTEGRQGLGPFARLTIILTACMSGSWVDSATNSQAGDFGSVVRAKVNSLPTCDAEASGYRSKSGPDGCTQVAGGPDPTPALDPSQPALSLALMGPPRPSPVGATAVPTLDRQRLQAVATRFSASFDNVFNAKQPAVAEPQAKRGAALADSESVFVPSVPALPPPTIVPPQVTPIGVVSNTTTGGSTTGVGTTGGGATTGGTISGSSTGRGTTSGDGNVSGAGARANLPPAIPGVVGSVFAFSSSVASQLTWVAADGTPFMKVLETKFFAAIADTTTTKPPTWRELMEGVVTDAEKSSEKHVRPSYNASPVEMLDQSIFGK